MAEPILRLDGIRKSYGDKVVTEVLHGIDLSLQPGEFAALIGPSGSGKSTLLNILGLLDRPSAGRLYLNGHDTSGMDAGAMTRFRGRNVGFIFQFHHLLPAFTSRDNVMMPLLIDRGWPDADMRARAELLLREVGLESKFDAKPIDMSGGQQQRVAIARALSMQPPLVLADEPTGNLDTHAADDAFELMRRFNREKGVTFLVVTHDPRLAARCDRIIRLVDGLVVSDERQAASSPA